MSGATQPNGFDDYCFLMRKQWHLTTKLGQKREITEIW